MKRSGLLLLVLILFLAGLASTASAAAPVNVYVNGVKTPVSSPPVWSGGTAYASRALLQQAAHIDAADKNGTVTLSQGSAQLVFSGRTATVNGRPVQPPEPPIQLNGTAYYPLAFVMQSLGQLATVDKLSNAVYLFLQSNHPAPEVSVSAAPEKPQVSVQTADAPSLVLPTSQTPSSGASSGSAAPDSPAAGSQAPPDPSAQPHITGIQALIDGVRIQADGGGLQPKAAFDAASGQLIVDLPNTTLGATVNNRPPVQDGSVPTVGDLIGSIHYALFSNNPNTVRVVLALKQNLPYSLLTDDADHSVKVVLKSKAYKVVIDAGHGGHDPGATSASGKFEKDFTLSVAKQVFQALQAYPDIQPIMTRSDDTYISLADRVALANQQHADLFLSIHGNISDSPAIRGTETYYWNDYSLPFAKIVDKDVTQTTGFTDRGVRQAAFQVIKNTDMPAVLLEAGYLSNPTEDKLMYSSSYQAQLAKGIVAAIVDQLHQQ